MRGKRKWRSHVVSVPRQILFEVVDSLAQVRRFYLGVYMPELSSQNVGLIHKLWVSVTTSPERRMSTIAIWLQPGCASWRRISSEIIFPGPLGGSCCRNNVLSMYPSAV